MSKHCRYDTSAALSYQPIYIGVLIHRLSFTYY